MVLRESSSNALSCVLICLLIFASTGVHSHKTKIHKASTSEASADSTSPPTDSSAASASAPSSGSAAGPTPASSSSPPAAPATGGGASASPGTPGVFDVTKFGAVADGKTESCKAFEAAWKEACGCAGDSTFLVPEGEFALGPVKFLGPCASKKSPKVEIRGTLKAPADASAFPEPTWIEFKGVCDLKISGTGTLDGQGEATYSSHGGCQGAGQCKNFPVTLRIMSVTGGEISGIKLLNSKGFHMAFLMTQNFMVHDMTITAPGTSPNTDGIHISQSSGISVTNTNIGVGDDCVSIGPGNTNICLTNIACGPGHGISVGSLGKYPDEKDVSGIHVKNCTMTGTDNGVRVKTWPGSPALKAINFTFEDITVDNVKNPVIIDQEYCPGHKCEVKAPSQVKISDIHFKNIKGSSSTANAVTLVCSKDVVCENVNLADIDIKTQGTAVSTCSNVKGLTVTGMTNPPNCGAGGAVTAGGPTAGGAAAPSAGGAASPSAGGAAGPSAGGADESTAGDAPKLKKKKGKKASTEPESKDTL